VKRPIRIDGDVAYVPLTKGYTAVIDADDVPLVAEWNWSAQVFKRQRDGSIYTVYAHRQQIVGTKKGALYLHRVIAGTPADMHTDHIDGDGLNNRRSNLRVVTRTQNMQNRRVCRTSATGLKGVFWHKRDCKWYAQIKAGGKKRHLGCFETKADAAEAYAAASAELHGEFGRTS
jgi:hypothetical protein